LWPADLGACAWLTVLVVAVVTLALCPSLVAGGSRRGVTAWGARRL
jgi:hypothetical protein